MKRNYLSTIIAIILFTTVSSAQNILTYFEKSNYLETPRYDETIKFCQQLAAASNQVHLVFLGKSPQGREIPMLIVDKDGLTNSSEIKKTSKAVILIEACIHAGESEGKDAGLMLIRDIISDKKQAALLDNATILFIPIFNVDGHERFGKYNRINQNGPTEMGWRTTAQNLNLNRDFMKADAPEMQHWLKMFNTWLPDFFMDSHTTDGADYQYVVTYELEISGNMDAGLTQWQRDIYLKNMEKDMLKSGYPIIPYVTFRNWHDPRSGLIVNSAPPMLSQGYTAQRNRPGMLIETHMLKDYKTRVFGTYNMFKSSIETVGNNAKSLKKAIETADKIASSDEFQKNGLAVNFETSMKDSTFINFLGVEYDGVPSDLTGGIWFQYSKIPKTFPVVYFDKSVAIETVKLPLAYIIPAEWPEVISKLDLHGIKYRTISKSTTLKLKTYQFENVKFKAQSYEGRQTVSFDCKEVEYERYYAEGSVIVETQQASARIIAYLLEPKAETNLVYWGFFNAIFEQKEYSESYVMEKVAREMISKNSKLKEEYELKKAQDKNFAKNPDAQYNWFYSKSPWWDDHKDIYPVGKIYDKAILNGL